MRESQHLDAEELQTFVEGRTPEGERAGVESHLSVCLPCQGEAEEWRSLFSALSSLPQFEPASGFADRVLAGMKQAHATAVLPWYVRGSRFVGRVAPKTTRGWALAAAFLALPLISGGLFVSWLISKAYVTPRTLWAFATDRGAHALQSLGEGTITWALNTEAASWAVKMSSQLVHQVGMSGVGALVAAMAIATSLSIWVLYKYLFRSTTREASYVSFSF